MLRFLLTCAVLLITPGLSTAQTAPEPTVIPLLSDWIPELTRLERLKADDITHAYADRTVNGIYAYAWQREQRFVEHHTADGRVSYQEGDFSAVGSWTLDGNNMCFEYDDAPGQFHCYHVFRYGGCLMTFPTGVAMWRNFPLNVRDWHSIQRYTDRDFKWPNRPPNEDDTFTCEAFMS